MTDRFSQKTLKLIFRRSLKGGNFGTTTSIKQRHKDLIFILRTNYNKVIGGRVYENIPQNSNIIADSKANIFSISHGLIFTVNS